MAKEKFELKILPDQLFFDREEAEKCFTSTSEYYDEVKDNLSQLVRKQWPVYREDSGSYIGPGLTTCCILEPCGCLLIAVILSPLIFLIRLAEALLKSGSWRWRKLFRLKTELDRNPLVLKEDEIFKVEQWGEETWVIQTRSGSYELDSDALRRYRLAGSPDVVYLIKGAVEVRDSKGKKIPQSRIKEILK